MVISEKQRYDANDRLSSDTYDANGNTTGLGANTYSYDFENRLISQNRGAVTIVYDGDGNRVSKAADGISTKYLVDDRNLTGYVQVLEETTGGTVQRVYTYGLNRISESQATGTSFYGYDGHGNVRILTDATGTVTDRYDYDAFGNIITQAGNTPNVYLYSGEQNDPNLGFYYLRARYYNSVSGRFATSDTFGGLISDPGSLHRYLFVKNDPVSLVDPSGHETLLDLTLTSSLIRVLGQIAVVNYNEVFNHIFPTTGQVLANLGIAAAAGAVGGVAGVGASELTALLANRVFGFEAQTLLSSVLLNIAQRSASGATSAAVGTITQELLAFYALQEPIKFTSSGELGTISFGGFVLGGFAATVYYPFSTAQFDITGFGPSARITFVSYTELTSELGVGVKDLYEVITDLIQRRLGNEF